MKESKGGFYFICGVSFLSRKNKKHDKMLAFVNFLYWVHRCVCFIIFSFYILFKLFKIKREKKIFV